ncbi:UNVERIFIED_CONTAM: Translin-associated factor X-interacting protein 1 [Siphonaria sp. JEL0065]|nr:Translin-associated factor X-interacting protein 1 [Siphonaria sp. JEL0065]
MDDDLKRWRKLGNDPFHHEPLSNGAIFHTKKKSHKHVPEHIPHKHPSKLNLIGFEHGRRVKQEKVFVHDVLERLSQNQKKDIDILWGGHLDHNNVNKILHVTPFQQRKFSPPRPPPKPSPIPGEYVPKTPDALSSASEISGLTARNAVAPLGHVDIPANMHDMLREFDSVKLQDHDNDAEDGGEEHEMEDDNDGRNPPVNTVHELKKPGKTGTALGLDKDDPARRRKYLPAYQLHLTKQGQYKALKNADHELVQSEWTRKQEATKADGLKELTKFLHAELEALGCVDPGPDMKRLQVYRYVFDRIIDDFKYYGPILAEIKNEYDTFISSYSMDQNELVFLRNKVRKLLAQNENRLLLKFERKKSIQMETLIAHLKDENEFLNSELRRKLTLYASYLPPAILSERKREDTMLTEVEPNIRKFQPGEDPITMYEKQIKGLTDEGQAKSAEIEKLKTAQEQDFVAKPIYDLLEADHEDVNEKFSKLKETHAHLEEELKQKVSTVAKLEAALREKEEQYHFLIAEYTGLTESMAKKGSA